MVRRLLLISISILMLSSCAFFGSSMFPMATSEKIGWFLNSGEVRDFYILDNGVAEDDPLLILVADDGTPGMNTRVLILDLSLNIRGFMSQDNPDNPITTDGIGFVDHNGDYVIGQTKIGRDGSTDPGDISTLPIPGLWNNSEIFTYTDDAMGTDHYLRVQFDGYVELCDDTWGASGGNTIANYIDSMVINQNNLYFSDFTIGQQSGNLYTYSKQQLYEHVIVAPILDIAATPPTTSVTNTNLSQWVTRCALGYFVSSFDGQYILYSYNGAVINSIQNKNWGSTEVVTIDYDCQFYYVADRNEGIIRKERVPF